MCLKIINLIEKSALGKQENRTSFEVATHEYKHRGLCAARKLIAAWHAKGEEKGSRQAPEMILSRIQTGMRTWLILLSFRGKCVKGRARQAHLSAGLKKSEKLCHL